MTTLTIETEDPQIIKAVKALLKGFEVPYKEDSDSPYDPEFVKKIQQGDDDFAKGNYKKITLDDIWK